MSEQGGGSKCHCNPGPKTKSFIFWVLSMFALMINGASVASTADSPWFTANGSKTRAGLWKQYLCTSSASSTCTSSQSWSTSDPCYKYGIGAGVILIVVVSISVLAFFFRLSLVCSKNPKWIRSFKAFMVLKSFAGVVGPATAIGLWTQNCYDAKKASTSDIVWSVGPGILILSMIFEVAALYGIRQAWHGGEGTKVED